MLSNNPARVTTFYMKLSPGNGPEGDRLRAIKHSVALDDRGDPVDASKTFLPRNIYLESGTWADTESLAKEMLDSIDWSGPALRPYRYLFMVTSKGRKPAVARLAAFTTTEVDDFRAGESPGAPIVVRNDPYLEIALGLTNRDGREVVRVDL